MSDANIYADLLLESVHIGTRPEFAHCLGAAQQLVDKCLISEIQNYRKPSYGPRLDMFKRRVWSDSGRIKVECGPSSTGCTALTQPVTSIRSGGLVCVSV